MKGLPSIVRNASDLDLPDILRDLLAVNPYHSDYLRLDPKNTLGANSFVEGFNDWDELVSAEDLGKATADFLEQHLTEDEVIKSVLTLVDIDEEEVLEC